MVEIKADKNLEKALSSVGKDASKEPENVPQLSKEEETGFHKGALNTLMAERNELIKIIANIEAIMQAHVARLKELGVNIEVQQPQKPEGK